MDTECEEKTLLGFPIGEKPSYCPWLVIASAYYATPLVYVIGVEALYASSLDQTTPLILVGALADATRTSAGGDINYYEELLIINHYEELY
eukprot:2542351-Pyramimonas_sp.AAC.1